MAFPQLRIAVDQSSDRVTVRVSGEIDIANSTRVKRVFDELLESYERATRICVDLQAVDFIDSSGIAVLLAARRQAVRRHISFGVTATSPQLQRLFAIAGLDQVLAMADAL
jgi:anti-sigma B factor antagonist